VPPNSLKIDLKYGDQGTGIRDQGKALAGSRAPKAESLIRAKIPRKPSWWTARATAGEVTPGFTKAEILKKAPEDPRAPDGVLNKVTELLEDLGA
jgi:hypothetical protein